MLKCQNVENFYLFVLEKNTNNPEESTKDKHKLWYEKHIKS